MFIAFSLLEDHGELLILGLSRENRCRLEAGQPIDVSRKTHGIAIPENLRIIIFAGETEASMAEQMKDLIGPSTVVDQKKLQ